MYGNKIARILEYQDTKQAIRKNINIKDKILLEMLINLGMCSRHLFMYVTIYYFYNKLGLSREFSFQHQQGPGYVQQGTKLEKVYSLYKNIYSSKYLSLNLRLRHYKIVITPLILSASEFMDVVRKGN